MWRQFMQEIWKIALLQVVQSSDSFSYRVCQQHTLHNKNDEYFCKNEVFWWLQQFFTHNGTFLTSAYIFWTPLIYFGRPLIYFGRPIDGFEWHFHEIYEILSLNRGFLSKAYIVLATHGQVSRIRLLLRWRACSEIRGLKAASAANQSLSIWVW